MGKIDDVIEKYIKNSREEFDLKIKQYDTKRI